MSMINPDSDVVIGMRAELLLHASPAVLKAGGVDCCS